MRDAGIDVPFVGGDGLYGADFGKAAGDAGEGAIITCPCVPMRGRHVRRGLRGRDYGAAPGAYAAEGFDAMTVFLDGIEDGARTREAMEEFVNDYDAEGLTKHIAFDENGDVPQDSRDLGLQGRGRHARSRGGGQARLSSTTCTNHRGAAEQSAAPAPGPGTGLSLGGSEWISTH